MTHKADKQVLSADSSLLRYAFRTVESGIHEEALGHGYIGILGKSRYRWQMRPHMQGFRLLQVLSKTHRRPDLAHATLSCHVKIAALGPETSNRLCILLTHFTHPLDMRKRVKTTSKAAQTVFEHPDILPIICDHADNNTRIILCRTHSRFMPWLSRSSGRPVRSNSTTPMLLDPQPYYLARCRPLPCFTGVHQRELSERR